MSFHIPSATSFLFYLKNLIIADLLTTLTILVKLLSESTLASRQLKVFCCRYSMVIFYFTLYISIILMTLICLDRYLKIVRPFGASFIRNKRFGKAVAILIWIVLFCTTAMPNMILTDQDQHNSSANSSVTVHCICLKGPLGKKWHDAVILINTLIFWICFVVMVVFYLLISKEVYESYRKTNSDNKKARRHTKARVYIIIAVFFLCFAPYHFTRIPYFLRSQKHCVTHNSLHIVKEITLWVTSTNTCLDPLIYLYLCKSFRRKFIKTVSMKKGLPDKPNYSKGYETST
ncbi:P2Y13 protein, partial [Amia calva]|nr:P2Y13 protein [Amia calva]